MLQLSQQVQQALQREGTCDGEDSEQGLPAEDPPVDGGQKNRNLKRRIPSREHRNDKCAGEDPGCERHMNNEEPISVTLTDAAWWYGGRGAKQRRCTSSSAPIVHHELTETWNKALEENRHVLVLLQDGKPWGSTQAFEHLAQAEFPIR